MTSPTKKPNFSSVQATVSSTEAAPVDFGNVRSKLTSTEEKANAGTGQTHVVAKGDTLSHIARKFYGSSSQWPLVFEANRDQLDNPDRIRPGQVLKIPVDPTPSD